jgi:hypothetical protein
MVMSNIGTIVLSLPSSSTATTTSLLASDTFTSTQVRLLSVANTCSRLAVGPLADFASPVASRLPDGVRYFPRKHHISRVVFLSVSTCTLAFAFLWTITRARSQEALWVLRYASSCFVSG